jgi:murein DD-endopeptidase MepM/ murein hydrolase activator NlpD
MSERVFLETELRNMERRVDLVDSVIDGLEIRDKDIYKEIFKSDMVLEFDHKEIDLAQIYAYSEEQLVNQMATKLDSLDKVAMVVDREIEVIMSRLKGGYMNPAAIPAIIPVEKFSLEQVGTSIGDKIHPYYKTLVYHDGMDLLSHYGTNVLATADGEVVRVEMLKKGMGTTIVIDHGDEIQTQYSHLNEVYVRKGTKVKRGDRIATVGTSGMTFAPALHYKVFRGGRAVEPIDYFFADVSPQVGRQMVIISQSTGQSMD